MTALIAGYTLGRAVTELAQIVAGKMLVAKLERSLR